MASVACTGLKYKFHNGVWSSSYTTKLYGGYAGPDTTRDHVAVLQFKTPAVSGLFTGTSLSIVIPYVRQNNAKSGTLYMKLYTSDPSTTSINNVTLTSSTCDVTATWNASDKEVHTATCTLTKTLNANTTYYLVIDASSYMQIGYSGYDSKYVISLTYTSYTNVTANTPTITNNNDGTFTITAAAGTAGTNNAVKSTTLYYRLGSSGDYTKASSLVVANKALTCADSVKEQTIYAYSIVDGTYNDEQSDTVSSAIPNYKAPGNPGKPALTDNSFKNNRLTVKQNWTYSWTAAAKTNDSSPVAGYRIRLWKNGKTIPIKDLSGNTLSTVRAGTTSDYIYDRAGGSDTSMIINPVIHGYTPGDTVEVSIFAYALNGKNPADKLFSGGGMTSMISDPTTVQNAGVLNIKLPDGWHEGQVWVKADGTWHEAETVNVKVDGAWKESQ